MKSARDNAFLKVLKELGGKFLNFYGLKNGGLNSSFVYFIFYKQLFLKGTFLCKQITKFST